MTRKNAQAIQTRNTVALWVSRAAVCLVFLINIGCALGFILFPENYLGSYELSGVAGTAALQGLGIAFIMWNATYPVVIYNPVRFNAVFIIILVQQTLGLVGESWLLTTIEAGHEVLTSGIVRFIVFDAAGLVLMLGAYIGLKLVQKSQAGAE